MALQYPCCVRPRPLIPWPRSGHRAHLWRWRVTYGPSVAPHALRDVLASNIGGGPHTRCGGCGGAPGSLVAVALVTSRGGGAGGDIAGARRLRHRGR